MNNGFSEQLFSAIDQIVDSKLAKITYGNELIAGKVVQKLDNQLYQIAYNGLYIEAYAEENKKYELNDHVHVCIPNGDFSSGDKIILGKFIYPNKNEVQTNLGWQSKMTKGITLTLDEVLSLPIAKQTETITTTIIPISTNTNDLSKYNCLNISASFEAIGLEEAHTGEYGLQFLFCHNDIIVNTREYKMSCLDDIFTTNPYSIIPNLNITTLFDINEIPMNLVNSIQVMLYADNNFEHTGSINLTNLTLTLGENIETFIDKPITIYSNNTIYNNAEQNNISIHTILVHPTTLDYITELPKDNTIYWYELMPGYSGDIYAGSNWKRIGEGTKLDNYIPNINTLSTSIKALWCEKINDDLYKTIGESNILVFNNALNNYINHAKDTVIKIIGKTYLPVYKDNDILAYTISPNYVYELSFLQNIEINTVIWNVTTDGLIAGFIDPNTNNIVNNLVYENGDFPTSVTISPLNYFDNEKAKSNVNVITCIVNNIYTAEIFIEFAQQSTQGTNYIFSIEPTGSDFLINSLGETQSFKAILTKIDGTPVVLEPNRLSWSWYQQDTFTTYDNEIIELATPLQQNYIDIMPDVLGNQATISLNKIFNSQFIPPVVEEVYDSTEIIGHRVTVPEEKGNTHILQAKYTIDAIFQAESQKDLVRTIELVARWPIKVISSGLIQDNLEINGQFELNWNNEGELVNFSTNSSANGAYSINQAPQAIWSIISEQPSDYYVINYRDAYILELPISTAYKSEKLSIVAISPDGELLYSQPLMLSLNNFSIDMTNKWAGGVVSIDEEAATIMATAMGAGHKNIDNSFTGVLMGDIQLNQQSAIDSGLFGFNNGQMVFKLNKDAEFFVGTDQYNYISFKDNFFDLKTQTLKLNALQDHFIIDSTGTTQAIIEQQQQYEGSNSIIKIAVPNSVIAINNSFIVDKDGIMYAKNAKLFVDTASTYNLQAITQMQHSMEFGWGRTNMNFSFHTNDENNNLLGIIQKDVLIGAEKNSFVRELFLGSAIPVINAETRAASNLENFSSIDQGYYLISRYSTGLTIASLRGKGLNSDGAVKDVPARLLLQASYAPNQITQETVTIYPPETSAGAGASILLWEDNSEIPMIEARAAHINLIGTSSLGLHSDVINVNGVLLFKTTKIELDQAENKNVFCIGKNHTGRTNIYFGEGSIIRFVETNGETALANVDFSISDLQKLKSLINS